MFMTDELDTIYDGFCNSDHKIAYILMCCCFPVAILLRNLVVGVYALFRGGMHSAKMYQEGDGGKHVVESWYYGRFTFDTKEKAESFCERNHLKTKVGK